LTGILFSGGYRKPVHLFNVGRGLLWGTIGLLLAYSLIPEEFRFSRVMIILGSFWAIIALPLYRILFSKLNFTDFKLEVKSSRRSIIVGHLPTIGKVKAMLNQAPGKPVIAGYVSLSEQDTGEEYLGNMDQIRDIVKINRIEEIIFCSEDLRSNEIISAMLELSDMNIDFKIAPPESLTIIGSSSIHTAGDLYLVDINAINRKSNRKMKRFFDFTLAFVLLVFIWIDLWIVQNKKQFLKNIFHVLSGRKSWVGYIPGQLDSVDLPSVKVGVLHPGMIFPEMEFSETRVKQINMMYAKDYSVWNDLEIVAGSLKKLDSKPNE
jgi:O-antigen biosynthesis protein